MRKYPPPPPPPYMYVCFRPVHLVLILPSRSAAAVGADDEEVQEEYDVH